MSRTRTDDQSEVEEVPTKRSKVKESGGPDDGAVEEDPEESEVIVEDDDAGDVEEISEGVANAEEEEEEEGGDQKNDEAGEVGVDDPNPSEQTPPPPPLALEISSKLKIQLVGDWKSITEGDKLVNLPSRNPVSSVLKRYVELKKRRGNQHPLTVQYADDLRVLFNRLLGSMLLYRQERAQYTVFLEVITHITRNVGE
eukprot:c6255_g1_i2.p1 GENE.c6255_g1_i2~~c6255_g1_i2.p1  ORF type:complete len:198 (-),score=44.48 c6255_g1_i2:335-928(-)